MSIVLSKLISKMLLHALTLFTIFQLTDSICFKETCKSDKTRQSGCRYVIKGTKDLTDDQCCRQPEGVGSASEIKAIGGGCYQCNSCTDVITRRDGGWSKWSDWTTCSETCGEGISTRERVCDNPLPSKLGKPCDGDAKETKKCMIKPCPIHGGWSSWSIWSPCSTSCEEGSSKRQRSCTKPAPNYGGEKCKGKNLQTKSCVVIPNCPIDGGWSKWSEWSPCNVTCSEGWKKRTRQCNNPPPQYNGAKCTGNGVQKIKCFAKPCPIDGGWSKWSEWNPCVFDNCEKSKDGVQRTKTRSCTNPTMAKMSSLKACFEKDNCAKDSEWSSWGSPFCNSFGVNRLRTCTNPAPAFGGKKCPGRNVDWQKKEDKNFCNICSEHCSTIKSFPVSPKTDSSGYGSGEGSDNFFF